VDQGESEQAKSRLYAFDGRTGEVLWQQVRRVGSSWSTPTLVENGGKMQIVATAVPRVNAYAADTGAELWQVEGINGEVTPSLVAFGELVFAVSPSEKLMAIRANGTGDVTKTHIAWSSEDFVPDISSPATDGELLFTLSTGGLVTCYDVKDGKKQWDHDYDSEFHASPAIAGRNVYLFSLKGHAVVVEAARQFKEVFRTEMPDTFISSPAFAQENVFLRGATNVWCVGPVRGQMAGAADSGGRVK
jgi:outer membrane protein assembly factor BamB